MPLLSPKKDLEKSAHIEVDSIAAASNAAHAERLKIFDTFEQDQIAEDNAARGLFAKPEPLTP